MISDNTNTLDKQSNIIGIKSSIAFGTSGGTLLVVLAQNLPDTFEYKSWLLIIAPSVSFALKYGFDKIREFSEKYIRKRNFNQHYKKCKNKLIGIINNKNTSKELKEHAQKQLDKLEMLYINFDFEKVVTFIKEDTINNLDKNKSFIG